MKKILLALTLSVPLSIASSAWSAPVKPTAKAGVVKVGSVKVGAVKWSAVKPSSPVARITALQYLLRQKGVFKGKADGKFTPQTVAAIKAFQKADKLKVDGLAGPQTLSNLVPLLTVGSKGEAVKAAQTLAREAQDHVGGKPNAKLKIDGEFGKNTREAIKVAQACLNFPEAQLKVDGVMGPRTWCLMFGGKTLR
jgi:peptidoglycan hydrolase-like protein with peptidoglycan-binding domain